MTAEQLYANECLGKGKVEILIKSNGRSGRLRRAPVRGTEKSGDKSHINVAGALT
jgi:hypothetical protein